VVKVAVVSPLIAVSELQGAALSLVIGNVGMCRIVRRSRRSMACRDYKRPGEEEPRLFFFSRA
jgi:hypothetical protein